MPVNSIDAVLTFFGCAVGAACPPTWTKQPLIFAGNPLALEET